MNFHPTRDKYLANQADALFSLWPLARSWRTFPGARLTNGQGLKAASSSDVA
jgi:hypothetical protein